MEGRELKYISAWIRALGKIDENGPLHRCWWRYLAKKLKAKKRVKIEAPGIRSVNR